MGHENKKNYVPVAGLFENWHKNMNIHSKIDLLMKADIYLVHVNYI